MPGPKKIYSKEERLKKIKAIENAISSGLSPYNAAKAFGIDCGAYRRWKKELLTDKATASKDAL